jgi:hypothetical protein
MNDPYNLKEERKELRQWWLCILGLIIIVSVIVGMVMKYAVLVGGGVEREVFEQPYQKKEVDKTTYDSKLADLRARLKNQKLDEYSKAEIRSQIETIEMLKASKDGRLNDW